MVTTDTATDSSLDSDNHNQGARHGPVVAATLDRLRHGWAGSRFNLNETSNFGSSNRTPLHADGNFFDCPAYSTAWPFLFQTVVSHQKFEKFSSLTLDDPPAHDMRTFRTDSHASQRTVLDQEPRLVVFLWVCCLACLVSF